MCAVGILAVATHTRLVADLLVEAISNRPMEASGLGSCYPMPGPVNGKMCADGISRKWSSWQVVLLEADVLPCAPSASVSVRLLHSICCCRRIIKLLRCDVESLPAPLEMATYRAAGQPVSESRIPAVREVGGDDGGAWLRREMGPAAGIRWARSILMDETGSIRFPACPAGKGV
jgi:hypothetical protein